MVGYRGYCMIVNAVMLLLFTVEKFDVHKDCLKGLSLCYLLYRHRYSTLVPVDFVLVWLVWSYCLMVMSFVIVRIFNIHISWILCRSLLWFSILYCWISNLILVLTLFGENAMCSPPTYCSSTQSLNPHLNAMCLSFILLSKSLQHCFVKSPIFNVWVWFAS